MKRWKTILSVLMVFVLGAVAGALVTHGIYQQRIERILADEPKSMREFIVQRLSHELHLDAAQVEQLRIIVKDTRAEMRNVRRQFRPQIEEILARSQDKVRAILRPEQLEKYEMIVAKHKKRREHEESSK